MNVVLFEPGELDAPLSGADPRAVHIRTVLRSRVGDKLQVGVIGGLLGCALIVEMDRESIRLQFDLSEESPPLYPVTLLIGHPRPIVIRRLLKDLSSLGVRRIAFAGTDLGEKSYQDTRLWENLAWREPLVEGASQARSTLLPEVLRFPGVRSALDSLLPMGSQRSNRVLFDIGAELEPAETLAYAPGETVVAIGSERGWSPRERELFDTADFTAVRVGRRTLRTETACIFGCALVLSGMQLL
ncbi:MAG TPA: RsmE family RNA methyltransferase [Spirochaetia bacterium]|nr:RsmE family RNA methyltransferase [Spirochaetia bacterium]